MRRCRWLLLIPGFSALTYAQPIASLQITSLTGNVSIRAADDAPWAAAMPGMAMAKEASILVGSKATAEIRASGSDSFVAGANSQVKFAGIDNDRHQVELSGGKITYQAADPAVESIRVNLPGVGVEPVQPGIYIIAQTPGGQSQVTVQTGLARVVASSGSELVEAGQKMLIRYSANGPEFRVVSAFSKWRRFLTVAGAAIQIAGNISAVAGVGSSDESTRKAALPPIKRDSSSSTPVDTRQHSDPPAKSGSPPPASRVK
jgi:hypothetical protein